MWVWLFRWWTTSSTSPLTRPTLGKTAGKDAAADKPTFVSLMGLAQAQAYADRVLAQAHDTLRRSGLDHTATLHALADWVGRRAS